MSLSAASPAPRPGRNDFWTRTWTAYERRHPADPPVTAQAFLCAGIAPSRARLREMARLSARLMPELAPEGAETDEVLDRHVFEIRAERGSGEAGLRVALGRLAIAPLPATGADLWLVTGYAPGAFALVPRVHHALLDGVGSSAVTTFVGRMLGGSARPPEPVPVRGVAATGNDRGTAGVWGACRAALVLADVALGVPPAARLAKVPVCASPPCCPRPPARASARSCPRAPRTTEPRANGGWTPSAACPPRPPSTSSSRNSPGWSPTPWAPPPTGWTRAPGSTPTAWTR
ncbi:wax ester/triacylglycerol synthase domain-containing protein [Streptomyces mobaraensis]|uniref:wax ester/triacylglycerol synthase domain-containing protein n=1 Tax=Streptomyces mobaraensis TaxID=35621 RepID=UPI00332AE2B4